MKNDHGSKFSNLSNWKEEAWKKSGLQQDSNPWPLRYQCNALPTELWCHTLGVRSINCQSIVWRHSSVGRASHQYRRGHGFESRWSPDFFQASFQLLKLENLLWWSFFTFIYNRSSNMNYFICTSHHFTPHRNIWTQLIDLAPNVWLHSSRGFIKISDRRAYGFSSRAHKWEGLMALPLQLSRVLVFLFFFAPFSRDLKKNTVCL